MYSAVIFTASELDAVIDTVGTAAMGKGLQAQRLVDELAILLCNVHSSSEGQCLPSVYSAIADFVMLNLRPKLFFQPANCFGTSPQCLPSLRLP